MTVTMFRRDRHVANGYSSHLVPTGEVAISGTPLLGLPLLQRYGYRSSTHLLQPKSLMVSDPKSVDTEARRVAVMQPYVFPYLGYFHLIESADVFVFYDDVRFRKKGWINRNRLLDHSEIWQFTVPVSGASQNRLICETPTGIDQRWRNKFFNRLRHAYGIAPFYKDVLPIVDQAFSVQRGSIADLAIRSVEGCYRYVGESVSCLRSSEAFPATRALPGAERLAAITRSVGGDCYVNAPGGRDLYNEDWFRKQGLGLEFIESRLQQPEMMMSPIPWHLSIIHLMMFHSPSELRTMLTQYVSNPA